MAEKALKILQVVPYFYPAWAYGGIPRVVYELSRELVRQGHDVTVYTTDVLDREKRYEVKGGAIEVDGVKTHYLKNLSNRLAYDFQIYLPMGLNSLVESTIQDFDIIHLHGHRHFLNNIVHRHAMRFKKPYILSGHGTVLRIERRVAAKRVFDTFFGRQILMDADHFIAVSGNEVKQYQEMGIDREKVSVIYNGIDISAFDGLPAKGSFRRKYNLQDKKVILYLGKITPRKGIDFLIRAASRVKTLDTVLVIAGNDMGFKKRVLEIVKELSLGDRVIFTGLLVGKEKLAAYRDSDVVVYPAVYEIFGLVPFEAIMCGTPVVVTDDCGCGEIIGREDIGYTVKYGDVPGLSNRIDEVLNSKDAATEKVLRGKQFVEKNLNWGLIGDKYVDVYRGIPG